MGKATSIYKGLFIRRFCHQFFVEVKKGNIFWYEQEQWRKCGDNEGIRLADLMHKKFEAKDIVIVRRS